jgi:hypothetical protein
MIRSNTMDNITEASSSVDTFTLPCGWLNGNDVVYDRVKIREITGEEEDMLSAKNLPTVAKMDNLLAACVSRLYTEEIAPAGDDGKIETYQPIDKKRELLNCVKQMPVGDRVFLLLAIRRVSLGDNFEFEIKCPDCGTKERKSVDLSTMDITEMTDKKLRFYDETLPSGKHCRMRILTGIEEAKMGKVRESNRDLMSKALMLRIESIDDSPVDLASVKALSIKDRNQLRNGFNKQEGGVDTGVDIVCNSCDNEYSTEMDIGQQGFFFPTE